VAGHAVAHRPGSSDNRQVRAPLTYAVRRLLRRPALAFTSVATTNRTILPAETEQRPPAYFLDGQLDRVEAVQVGTTRDAEFARARGAEWVHAGVTLHRFEDAVIVAGSAFAAGARLRLVPGSLLRAVVDAPRQEIAEAALDCTWVGGRFFGHWLTDDCSTHLLAKEHAPPIGVDRLPYAQEDGYCRLLGIQLRKVTGIRVRSLLVFQDFGQNSSKRARYQRMRAVLGRGRPAHRGSGVYLHRGTSGALRLLENEEEIEERLTRRGFSVVDPARLSADEVVAACAGAPCVVGVEGSSLAHGIMTVAEGGAIVTLQPPWSFNNIFKDYADCLRLPYGFVLGSRTAAGFRVDADELERTLDLLPRI